MTMFLAFSPSKEGGGCLHPSAPASQQRWFRASCKNEGMKVLAVSGCRHSEHTTFTFDTMLRSLVICFGMDGSFLPVSNVSSMPINLSLLPEPIASCPSLATKAQNPSNHCSQQLPEVPPTNSDDTIPIAPRPPSSLTTELEPAARPQVPRNH